MKQTAIDKFVEYAENNYSALHNNETWLDKARELQAQEKSTPQTMGNEGLREALGKLIDDNIKYAELSDDDKSWIKTLENILSSHQSSASVESLAELADRKGYVITRIDGKSEGEYKWAIGIMFQDKDGNEGKWKGFESSTYFAAEQKAREYLNSLPDKENA